MSAMSDSDLIAEKKRAQQLADLCQMHGHIDGATAMRAVANAITDEQVHRSRGGTPNGG